MESADAFAKSADTPYRWAVATSVVVLAIYLATLAPTTAFWDTSEYIAAAKVLGIPHPPGSPLFVMVAHVWGLLPLAAHYAERINLFAAVTSALAAGLWFLVAERWLRSLVADRRLRLAASFAGVLVGATSWTVWNQSTVNEKVYTLSMFSMALVTWLAVHWGDDQAGPHRDRWLILIAYLLALTSTNHMMGVLAAPAVAVYVLWTDWRVLTRPAILAGIALAVVIGLTPNYLFLPIRAGQFPPINEGEPVGFFSQALSDVLNRVQYGKPSVFKEPWPPSELPRTPGLFFSQLANYWQYFGWQFARDWGRLAALFTALFTVCGLTGLWTLFRRDRRAGVAALAMLGTVTFALVFYLNFKYGFSMYPDRPGLEREVRERDYFFVGSFAFFGTLVAIGLGTWAQGLLDWLGGRVKGAARWAVAAPILALGLVPLFGNRITASRDHEYLPRDFAHDLLQSVEPYGILITAGDNDTFPLWYAQEVEGIRRDVTIANLSLMNTDWHLRQLRRREPGDFDPAGAVDLWKLRSDTGEVTLPGSAGSPATGGAGVPWTRPAVPVFGISERELDSLPEYTRVPKGSGVPFDSLIIAFGDEILDRKDLAVLLLIQQNIGKRAIYFAWSAGGYPDQTFNLTPWLVSEGLARRLSPTPVTESGPIVLSPVMGYVDLERSKSLLWNGYRFGSATRDRPRGWVDAPSSSILQLYAIIYGGLAATFRQHGDADLAARADSVAAVVRRELEQGDRFVSRLPLPPPAPPGPDSAP